MDSPVSFFAPNFCVFFAPRTFAFRGPAVVAVLRKAAEEVVRGDVVSDPARGDDVRAILAPDVPLPAPRNGDGVRPTIGGVAVRDTGGVGRLIVGLSHDEKKSSSGSPAGVDDPSPAAPPITSVITTSEGYLHRVRFVLGESRVTYSCASFAARLFNSSLYLVAAFD